MKCFQYWVPSASPAFKKLIFKIKAKMHYRYRSTCWSRSLASSATCPTTPSSRQPLSCRRTYINRCVGRGAGAQVGRRALPRKSVAGLMAGRNTGYSSMCVDNGPRLCTATRVLLPAVLATFPPQLQHPWWILPSVKTGQQHYI